MNNFENIDWVNQQRRDALNWWNNLSSAEKTKIVDLNTVLLGMPRMLDSLTGREIQQLYSLEILNQ